MLKRPSSLFSTAVLFTLAGIVAPAFGQGQAPPPPQPAPPAAPAATSTPPSAPDDDAQKQPTNVELLNDFVHYTLIDRADLARTMGQALIDRNLSGPDMVTLVDKSIGYKRFTEAVIRAQRRPELEPVAARLLLSYEAGQQGVARHPDSIERSIKQLKGMQRERLYARERLLAAGEYAMPQLLEALLDTSDNALQAQVRQVVVDLGRHSIIPLVTALPHLNAPQQELVIRTLQDIPYPTSAPFIYDILRNPTNAAVRTAAENAARRVTGAVNTALPVADRYVDLANEYYGGSPSLISFPTDANQPIWNYLAGAGGAGLTFQAVDTRLFPATMAMRLSEEALRRDAANGRALSTWLAANFTRELRTPKEYVNPAYPSTRRDAMYYAVAAGAGPCQDVLARALDHNDAPLARKALSAIERTAGGRSLWTSASPTGRRPILEALRFPNRRVQYDSALALGAAGPREPFPGSDQVVRILGSAIRDAGARYAIVLAGAERTEEGASIADVLRAQGYTPLPPATRLSDIGQAVVDAPGIDLIVTDLPALQTQETIEHAHSDPKLRATPILALLSAQGNAELAPRYSRDMLVRLGREGFRAPEIIAAAQQLVDEATGGEMKADESTAYKMRSLGVLRDLGISANGVMNVGDAQGALIAALSDPKSTPELRQRVADVLIYIPTSGSQNALMDAAMAATGEDRVRLLGRLADSAKRSGNLLAPAHVDTILELAQTGQGAEATAAAALMGALNLPNARLVPLILGSAQ